MLSKRVQRGVEESVESERRRLSGAMLGNGGQTNMQIKHIHTYDYYCDKARRMCFLVFFFFLFLSLAHPKLVGLTQVLDSMLYYRSIERFIPSLP